MFEIGRGGYDKRWEPRAPAAPLSDLHDRPASRGFQRDHRRPLKRSRIWIGLAGLAAAVVAVGATAVSKPRLMAGLCERLGLEAVAPYASADGLLRLAGFGIDQVALTGHRQTADSDVFDALDLANARSIASFDPEGVRARLERLPWVASADVTRVYPDGLQVRLTERRPFAVWRRGTREFLVDGTGRVLTEVNRSTGLGLPRIAGEGAADEARSLFETLARFPAIAARFAEAERVGNRRWRLVLKGGVTLELPPDQEQAALDLAVRDPVVARFVAGDKGVVDLRVAGRVAIRRDAAQAAANGAERS